MFSSIVSQKEWHKNFVLAFVIMAIMLAPVLFGNRVLMGDSLDAHITQLTFYKDAIQKG